MKLNIQLFLRNRKKDIIPSGTRPSKKEPLNNKFCFDNLNSTYPNIWLRSCRAKHEYIYFAHIPVIRTHVEFRDGKVT